MLIFLDSNSIMVRTSQSIQSLDPCRHAKIMLFSKTEKCAAITAPPDSFAYNAFDMTRSAYLVP